MSLLETESSISEFISALEMADFDAFDGLKADVEGQMQQRNALTGELVDTFNGIVSCPSNGLQGVFMTDMGHFMCEYPGQFGFIFHSSY